MLNFLVNKSSVYARPAGPSYCFRVLYFSFSLFLNPWPQHSTPSEPFGTLILAGSEQNSYRNRGNQEKNKTTKNHKKRRTKPEHSPFLILQLTTKLQESRWCGEGIRTKILINGTELRGARKPLHL